MPKTPKTKPKTYPKKQSKKTNSKMPTHTVSITKSKFYWIVLTVVAIVCMAILGFTSNIPIQKVALIMVTVLSVLGLAGYVRVKSSNLSNKMRATYLFVGAAVIGFGIWAIMLILLTETGLGVQVANSLGDQLFIISSQVIFLVIGAFVGEGLGKNMTFQSFVSKIRQKF